jgi:hypothetical protein
VDGRHDLLTAARPGGHSTVKVGSETLSLPDVADSLPSSDGAGAGEASSVGAGVGAGADGGRVGAGEGRRLGVGEEGAVGRRGVGLVVASSDATGDRSPSDDADGRPPLPPVAASDLEEPPDRARVDEPVPESRRAVSAVSPSSAVAPVSAPVALPATSGTLGTASAVTTATGSWAGPPPRAAVVLASLSSRAISDRLGSGALRPVAGRKGCLSDGSFRLWAITMSAANMMAVVRKTPAARITNGADRIAQP